MIMTISELQRLRSPLTGGPDKAKQLPSPLQESGEGIGFGQALNDAIGQVNDAQKEAGEQMNAFISGEQQNVQDVMISMNQAQLSFQLMTEVRNKLMDTYQELMRMQV